MFCTECGKPLHGKFCAFCGTARTASDSAVEIKPLDVVPDWEGEVQYESILRFPGVRETIERHSQQAIKPISGEQFLALADNLVPLGVSLESLASIAQPLYARLGIKTGKQRSQQVQAPFARVMVRALCSLARRGQSLRKVTQALDGCLLEATLPSDLCSLEGDLLLSLRRVGSLAEVSVSTRIPGQLYDWGKSNRCLEHLFADLASDAA